MSAPLLKYPVQTLDNLVLLPAGTLLTTGQLEEIARRGRRAAVPMRSLLDHESALHDLKHYLASPPYAVIFADAGKTAACLELMTKIEMVEPFLRILDHFRRHDRYTYRHMLMVFALTTLLARDLVPETIDRLREAFAGPTHDIGKICVPLSILTKTTPLTHGERRHLEHHPLAGQVLLTYYLHDHEHFAVRVARDHHECKDGSGYPMGRRDSDPLVEIITVCDIYDALISPRPYRPLSFDNRTAIEEITRLAETGKIGWYAVKALVAHNRGTPYDPSRIWVSPEKRGTPPEQNNYGHYLEN